MFADYSPVPNFPPSESGQVLVIERHDSETNAEDIIAEARRAGATSVDGDGDEIFWIVFASEPRRVWDFTLTSLQNTIKKM
ncbi:TPA: hypothetical protein DEP58_03220 [Patescibacteria group bacterium]|nr:MAG: hypothetical protein UU98_C0028G0009 [Parcubacteria group bacterium GW2011_GWD2_42_14]HCC05291.1 hypothetical protein [Patescibacteria group bacterium]